MNDKQKKFLLGTSIGGFELTDSAALYLDSVNIYGTDRTLNPANFTLKDGKYYTQDGHLCVAYSYAHSQTNHDFNNREVLIPLVEKLEYNYTKLDELNDGYELRIQMVPFDANVFISSDSEYGCEFLEERHSIYTNMSDYEVRTQFLIKKIFDQNKEKIAALQKSDSILELDYDYLHIKVSKNYAVVDLMEYPAEKVDGIKQKTPQKKLYGHVFLRAGEYYRPNSPCEVVYDIVYFGAEPYSARYNTVNKFIIHHEEWKQLHALLYNPICN
jgi:hypothetical protein